MNQLRIYRMSLKKDGTIPIMGRITIGKQMAQFSAKLSVAISLWDIKAARALGKSKVVTDLNRALDKIAVSIHTSYEELIERKGTATPKEVAVAFQGMASGQESLLGYCDKFHKMMLQRIRCGAFGNSRGVYEAYGIVLNLMLFSSTKT